MNQFPIDNLLNDLNPGCAELAKLAEKELASFFRAVTRLFGAEQAELSAEDWLREATAADRLPSSAREWRRITVKASTMLATRINASSVHGAMQCV